MTLPRGKGPFPALLLVSGSGPHDRDETVLDHKPFLVLADYLTRRDIAVLRVDKRGVGGSTGDTYAATVEDNVDDVVAGIQFLKRQKEIRPDQIGLLGHSEGGLVAPLAAVRSGDAAFIVLMAGMALSGEETVYLQIEREGKSGGAGDELIAASRRHQAGIFAILKAEQDDALAARRLRQYLLDARANAGEKERKQIGDPEQWIQRETQKVMAPWFRSVLTYDPVAVLRRVTCPVLAITGEKDLYVPARENLRAIEQALRDGGNRDYTVKELPQLNHMLQTATTGTVGEFGTIQETLAPVALETIAEWVSRHVNR